MSKLYDTLMDLREQREELLHEVAMAELGQKVSVEIGSDVGAELAAVTDASDDLDEAIAAIEDA